MNAFGDILENDIEEPPVAPTAPFAQGFPAPLKIDFSKPRARRMPRKDTRGPQKTVPKEEPKLSEAQKIHEENLKKIAELTEEQIEEEKADLLGALDPKLIQSLLKRTQERSHHHDHAEGYDGWVGGGKNGVVLPHLDSDDVNKALGVKSVKFADVVEHDEPHGPNEQEDEVVNQFNENEDSEDDEVAPEGYQIVPESDIESGPDVHFPKPRVVRDDPTMDINDPGFLDQMHEKYYPDLPKETRKLAWMQPSKTLAKPTMYGSVSEMRFDFRGDLVPLETESGPTSAISGLHHHLSDPQLAGYSLPELARFTRSSVAAQRSIGIQTLGRILHKLGLHEYGISPVGADDETPAFEEQLVEMKSQLETMIWDQIDKLQILESITEASDEKFTKNLSVRNYALEALWLWKQGGGRPAVEEKSEEQHIAEHLHQL